MAKFIFKKRLSKRSRKDNKSFKTTLTIRKPSYISVFQHEHNGDFFEFDDVAITKYKRNQIIKMFFDAYSNKVNYQLFEFGVPFSVSISIGSIIQKIKRKCSYMNNELLGYIWVYDVGEENFGEHYHLVIATKKVKKCKYPDELKINFKGKKVHGDFVKTYNAFKNYLLGKQLYDRGYKKRLFGKSKIFAG